MSLKGNESFLILTKGLENKTFMRPDEILIQVLGISSSKIAVLSGPTHAENVILKYPTAAIIASQNIDLSIELRDKFNTSFFRLYTSDDIKGVELGGALKNIYAAAAGMVDGLGYGDNAKAALLTRAIPEMIRIGMKLGAKPRTFVGLSGIGDLMVTAYSKHSRNRYLGEMIAKTGKNAKEVVSSMDMVAESYYSSESFYNFSRKNKLYTPILDLVYSIFYESEDLSDIQHLLLSKPLKSEYEGDEFWLENF
jgi:glycerol-3-phosphate dehydrogenase (NAD(P)+)